MDLGNGRLSIEGVDMLMGNDLAKLKVEITHSPRRSEMRWAPKLDPDKKGTRARIVTRTQARTRDREEMEGCELKKNSSRAMLKSDGRAKEKLELLRER